MGLAVGDHAQLARRYPPRTRRGSRGAVVRVDGDWATIKLPSGETFEARTDDLIRLVPGEEL